MSEELKSAVPLTKTDFDKDMNLTSNKCKSKTIILFYSPMCGHCSSMKPDFEALAQAAQSGKLGNDVTVAAVNTMDNMDLMKMIHDPDMIQKREFTVEGVPTIVGYKDGKYFSTYAPGDSKEEQENFRKAPDMAIFVQGIGSAPVTYK